MTLGDLIMALPLGDAKKEDVIIQVRQGVTSWGTPDPTASKELFIEINGKTHELGKLSLSSISRFKSIIRILESIESIN